MQFRVNLFWWVHCFLALHFKFFQCCCIGILKQTEPTVFTLWRGYQPTHGFTCSCLCILNWNMNWKHFTPLTSRKTDTACLATSAELRFCSVRYAWMNIMSTMAFWTNYHFNTTVFLLNRANTMGYFEVIPLEIHR